jgi:hypothetical protein
MKTVTVAGGSGENFDGRRADHAADQRESSIHAHAAYRTRPGRGAGQLFPVESDRPPDCASVAMPPLLRRQSSSQAGPALGVEAIVMCFGVMTALGTMQKPDLMPLSPGCVSRRSVFS